MEGQGQNRKYGIWSLFVFIFMYSNLMKSLFIWLPYMALYWG